MSCLNLMSLLPRKKVWKLFTSASKLTLKLHKLNKSKTIKKHNKSQSSYKSTPKKLGWPSVLSIQPKKFKNKKTRHRQLQNYRYYKRPPPVFVDQLFIEPVPKERAIFPPGVASTTAEEDGKEKSCPSSSSSKRPSAKSRPLESYRILDHETTVGVPPESYDGETSSGVDEESMVSADDMWESMVMASPQLMDGINERAEQFIARFRADMHKQELQLARRL